MESNYTLIQSNNSDSDKKDKIHSSAYYKFIEQIKNHIRKIENDYCGEEIKNLENQYDLIREYEQEFENQRENCLNNYSTLKDEITEIENTYPNIDIGLFSGFFENFEEYYLFFTKASELLSKFNQFNDEAQSLYFIIKRQSTCIEALKDMNLKISDEYAEKIEKYEAMEEEYKELLATFDNIKNNVSVDKNSTGKNNYVLNINENGGLVEELNNKIKNLSNEYEKLKKTNTENEKQILHLKDFMKSNCILRSKNVQSINELEFKIKKYEIDNTNLQTMVNELREENEKLIKDKEYLEEQINLQLDAMKIKGNDEVNENNNLACLLEEDDDIKNNDNVYNTNVNNLGDLLCEEEEKEDTISNEENKKESETEKTNEKNIIDNNNKNNNNVTNLRSLRKVIKSNIKESANKYKHLSSTVCTFRKRMSQSGIKNAYKLMFQKNEKVNKVDYFMQFFFLLFQSMKMNSNNVSQFLNYDPEVLYNECKKEHVPYHKFHEWIISKLDLDEKKKIKENFSTITGIICTSLM